MVALLSLVLNLLILPVKQMVEPAYRWPMEKRIETSIEATSYAHKNGLEVVFFPIDFSRAELKWALDLIEKVGKEGHVDVLILGSGLYQIESGIIASRFKNCGEKHATELFPMRWSAVGQPPAEEVMSKGSGIDSVNQWLQELGMQVSEEDAMKVTAAVKAHSLKNKKMLSKAEFRDLARKVLGKTQVAAE